MNKLGGYLYELDWEKRKEIIYWLMSTFGDPRELVWAPRGGGQDQPIRLIKVWNSDIRLLLLLQYSDHIKEVE
jgi:hypothetical protein